MIKLPVGRTPHLALGAFTLAIFSFAPNAIDTREAWSQTRTIKIVNPFPPGGTADMVARVLGEQIARSQRITVVVENRPGASTVLGTEAVMRAEPDGNTVLITVPELVLNPQLRKLNYDPLTSFEPICNLVLSPQVILVNGASSYRTLADLITAARSKPGELTFASVGPASALYIAIEKLKREAKVDITYVPFPGNAPTINALLGRHVTAGVSNYSDIVDHVKAGTLRAIATLSSKRIEMLPDVPTVAESGYAGYAVDIWFGLFAPATTPNEKISQLAGWFTAAMQERQVKDKFSPSALQPVGTCGVDFRSYILDQFHMYGRVIRDANIKVE
jgi:tripartite-type tricarboxylate transporter receptor subunit TctC